MKEPKHKVYPGARVEPKVQAKLGAWIINPNPEYAKVKNIYFIDSFLQKRFLASPQAGGGGWYNLRFLALGKNTTATTFLILKSKM